MLPVVILAGGLATRLYPVTRKIPKALIPVAGRPFIDHQLGLLREKGVTEVVLCVGNLGRMIETHVGDGARYGLGVRYSYDGDRLLGTGGAIKHAAGLLPDAFLILYGDSYLDIDLEPVEHRFFSSGLMVLMTVFRNRDMFGASNIVAGNGKVVLYDKTVRDPRMEYIDYGLIALRKSVFDPYPPDEPFDLAVVLSRAAAAGSVAACEVGRRFYEIGSIRGIEETEDYIRNRKPRSGKDSV